MFSPIGSPPPDRLLFPKRESDQCIRNVKKVLFPTEIHFVPYRRPDPRIRPSLPKPLKRYRYRRFVGISSHGLYMHCCCFLQPLLLDSVYPGSSKKTVSSRFATRVPAFIVSSSTRIKMCSFLACNTPSAYARRAL